MSLDAARAADHHGLWTLNNGNKAKVPFDRDIGSHHATGQPRNVVNVYRKSNGTIHVTPGSR